MPLIHALPVATTVPGTPRASATVSYNGTSDKSIQVQPVCPTWSTADPAITVTIEVQQSFDNGASWADFARMDTHAGALNRQGALPYIVCQVVDNLGPRLARVVLSVGVGSLDVGVDLTA